MALDPRAAMLKINQERMDVQKGLAASQAEIGRKMTKKGRKGAWGKWLGQLAAPVLADWGTTALLNVVAPGLGSLYKAAKGVPLLKAGAKGLLTAYGGAKGAEMGAGSVSVGESEDLMKKYMAGTVSGEKGMRFDRGATEAMEAQKDLQLEALDTLMKDDAMKSGLKAAGSSLLGSLKTASEARMAAATGGGATDAATSVSDRLKTLRETQGDLTTQDYLSAFTDSGKQAKKDLLSTQSLKDWSAKREGMNLRQVMKWSDEDLAGMAGKVNLRDFETGKLSGPQLPTNVVDDSFMQEQLNQSIGIQGSNDVGSVRMFEQAPQQNYGYMVGAPPSASPGFRLKDHSTNVPEGRMSVGMGQEYQEMLDNFPTYGQATQQLQSNFSLQPMGYDKLMQDLENVKPKIGMDLQGNKLNMNPTWQSAPSNKHLMRGLIGKNYYDQLSGTFNTPMLGQGGNY